MCELRFGNFQYHTKALEGVRAELILRVCSRYGQKYLFFRALQPVLERDGKVCSNGHGGGESGCYRCLILERLTGMLA